MSDQEKKKRKKESISISPQPDAEKKKEHTELSEEELRKISAGRLRLGGGDTVF